MTRQHTELAITTETDINDALFHKGLLEQAPTATLNGGRIMADYVDTNLRRLHLPAGQKAFFNQ